MTEYRLHCFAQSGNAYRAALMLNLIGADWEPVFVDFFNGETRTAAYRSSVNEMGEAPVLVHGEQKLTQSGVILEYLAGRSGKFLPSSEDDRLEALRWILRNTRASAPGSTVSRRCRAGNWLTSWRRASH